jgi:hypothetical protein
MKKAFLFSFIFPCFFSVYSQYNSGINDNPNVKKLLEIAEGKIGSIYISGAMGPNTFDCSGFTQFLYKQIDVEIPRTAREQYYYRKGKIVSPKGIRKGDLVFFISDNDEETKIGHVGMAITDYSNGDFQFIHSCPSKGVGKNKYSDNFYNNIYAGARRIIRYDKRPAGSELVDTISIADNNSEIELEVEEDSLWAFEDIPDFPENEDPEYTYTVKGNEKLLDISRKFLVSVDNIKEWNGLKSNSLKPNQRLKIYIF